MWNVLFWLISLFVYWCVAANYGALCKELVQQTNCKWSRTKSIAYLFGLTAAMQPKPVYVHACGCVWVCVCVCVYAEDCARACSIQIYSKQFYSNRKKLIRGTYQLQQQHWLIKVPSPHVWPVNSYIYTSGFLCVCASNLLSMCVCCG